MKLRVEGHVGIGDSTRGDGMRLGEENIAAGERVSGVAITEGAASAIMSCIAARTPDGTQRSASADNYCISHGCRLILHSTMTAVRWINTFLPHLIDGAHAVPAIQPHCFIYTIRSHIRNDKRVVWSSFARVLTI